MIQHEIYEIRYLFKALYSLTGVLSGEKKGRLERGSRTAVTAAVLNIPLVTDLEEDIFDLVKLGQMIIVDVDQGVIEILE